VGVEGDRRERDADARRIAGTPNVPFSDTRC